MTVTRGEIPPEATAFVLAQRNFDAIPVEKRASWSHAFQEERQRPVAMPERLIIEVANTCNLDCPMCRVGQNGVNLARVMPLARFEQLGEELFPLVRDVRLNGLGESTIVPNVDAYLDVLGRHGVNVELITNGTGSREIYCRMVDDGATLLFSWDAASADLFGVLRRPARLGEVQAVVADVASHAAAKGRADNLHLLFTLQPANIGELEPVVGVSATMGIPNVVVNVAKLPREDWLHRNVAPCLAAFEKAHAAARDHGIRLFLPDSIGDRPVTLPSASPTPSGRCDCPWNEAVIRWDLDVQVCNMFNPYTYGNLALAPFRRIWEGAFAHAFRRNLGGPAPHPYCEGCAYIGEVYARKRS